MNRATQDTNSNMGVDQLPFLPTRRGSHPIRGGNNIKCSHEDGGGLLVCVKRSRTTRSPHRSGKVLPHRSRERSSSSSSRSTSSSGSTDEPRRLRERRTLPAPPSASPHNSRPAFKRPPQRRSRSFNGLSRLRRSISPALPTVTEFVKANFEREDEKVLEGFRRSRSFSDLREASMMSSQSQLTRNQHRNVTEVAMARDDDFWKPRNQHRKIDRFGPPRHMRDDRFLPLPPPSLRPSLEKPSSPKDLALKHPIVRARSKERSSSHRVLQATLNSLEDAPYHSNFAWPRPLESKSLNDLPANEEDQDRKPSSTPRSFSHSPTTRPKSLGKPPLPGAKSLSPTTTPRWAHLRKCGKGRHRQQAAWLSCKGNDDNLQTYLGLASSSSSWSKDENSLLPESIRMSSTRSSPYDDQKIPFPPQSSIMLAGQRPAFEDNSALCKDSASTCNLMKIKAPPISPQRSISPRVNIRKHVT